ncbi:unnamed protein product [Caenorhabditis bovis]|uniref:DUF7754 domain-containing protein n=1 Tax=Caenorhabditis bovis TaxID=2654633 RepID=A0A8S1EXQ5_9PELO|nr:unnamed protein product [Caenorhabditis bovis]
MSLSELSLLSAETAISFHDIDLEILRNRRQDICVFIAVDDQNLSNSDEKNVYTFGDFKFYVDQVHEKDYSRVFLNVGSSPNSEWSLLVQLRIKTGQEASVLNVVDKDVFKFDAFSYPINVEVTSSDVKYLKFEMRVLNMLHLEHPLFNEGAITIEFDDGSTIHIYANILALLSDYMAKIEKLATTRSEAPNRIKVVHIEKAAFLELLYQVYPTRRPIYAAFRRLVAAAVGYKCDTLIYHLSKHLIEYNYRPLTFHQRFQAAIENRLEPAIRELAFRAARDGTWDRMIQQGFEPEQFCGRDVYHRIVCPAILAGRQAPFDATTLRNPTPSPTGFLELEPGDETKSVVLFRGTKFYVNSGLLEAHGKHMFSVGQNGELIARYTPEFQRECARENLLPGKVLLELLSYMLPMGDLPDPTMIRACIVFCYDHEWNVLKENLELELEPPITANEYMSQLVFAEKFELANLMRVNVQRAESSCRELAERLEREGVLKQLKQNTRDAIMDRMCSGWGLNPQVNRLATRVPTTFNNRLVNMKKGKPLTVGEGRAIDTLNSIESEYAFGQPNELVVLE